MNVPKDIITHEKLINLFFFFIIGTTCLWVYFFFPIPHFSWQPGLRLGILLLGFFSYEFVFLSLISHYIAHAKKKFASSFKKNKHIYLIIFVSILGLTYLVLNTIIEKSILVFLRDLMMIILIIVATPFVSGYISKRKKEKQKNGRENE